MKRLIIVAATAVLAAGAFALSAAAQEPVRGSISAEMRSQVRNSYIFTFSNDVSSGQVRGRAAALVRQAGGTMGHAYGTVMKGFSARMGAVAADNLFRNNDDVIAYTRDGIASIAARGGKKGKPATGGGSTSQTTPWGVKEVGGSRNGIGTTVCVIDTGVDFNHLDLDVNEAKSRSFVLSGSDYANPDDQNGHGTHVAGTIAALNNSIDVVGVAAGAEVVSVRVLDKRGSGWWSWVIAGVNYVATEVDGKLPCDVANMSLGGGGYTLLDTAVRAAADNGVKFALAAGNSGVNAKTRSPARVEHPNVYTVSAIDKKSNFASWSNYGGPTSTLGPVEYAAPGVSIKSLWKGGGTKTISGTSMAAPHVAGLLLLNGALPQPESCSSNCAVNDPDKDPDPIAKYVPPPPS